MANNSSTLILPGSQLILKDSVTKKCKIRVVTFDDESLEIVEYLLKKPLTKHGYLHYNSDTEDRVNSNIVLAYVFGKKQYNKLY